MSRIIQNIATVQFQVNARQANAAMQALQTEAEALKREMDKVNTKIANLGNVPPDHAGLKDLRTQLAGVTKDYNDVIKAQRDFMKGAKAADELWKAATAQNIEGLSFRSIKAGQNGLRKRQEGLAPGNAQDMQQWRIIQDVIDEADRVVTEARHNVEHTIQVLRDGGKVSEQTLRQTVSALKELKGSVEEDSVEFHTYRQELDFVTGKMQEFSDAQRRAKGEIVDANDARREMAKLTKEGATAAKQQEQQAEEEIRLYRERGKELQAEREGLKQNIDETKNLLDAKQKLIVKKHGEIAADEDTFNAQQKTRLANVESLKKEATAERELANQKSDNAEQQKRIYDLQMQTTERLGAEVEVLRGKLEALGKTEAKPKVDTSALDAMKQEIADIESQLNEMGGMHTADMKAFNERLWHKQDKMKEVGAQNYKSLTTDPDADYFNFGNKAKKIIKSFAAGGDDRRHDLMYSLSERGGYLEKLKELESEHRAIVKQRTEYLKAMDETGKKDWEEAVRQLDELDSAYSTVISILKDYKQQFDKIKPADDAHMEKYEQLTERRATLLEKVASAEQQSTTATNDQTEAEKLYNQKVEERIRLEKELEAVKIRSWRDDPEIKRLSEEIAKLDELIAVSDKYKKQFAKMSDSKFEEGYMGGDSEVRKALHIENDPQKSIWGAADYLKGAYLDRDRASLAEFVKENYPDDGTVAEYQQAAERVAKGIVQNAQENFRRAIYKEIQDGNWTSEAMEQKLDTLRRNFQNEFRNARSGELRSDPDYNYYKYAIAQMEKYIEVARQVEAEREKIAGGKEYIELAREKDDLDQPHEGLVWQRQKRAWDSAVIRTDEIDRRREEDVRVATEAVAKAKGEEADAERKLNEVKQQSTTATNDQTEAIKKQEEELGKLKRELASLQDGKSDAQDDLDYSNKEIQEYLKQLEKVGLKEEDLSDENKVQQAIEKATAEILGDELKTEERIVELRKQAAREVTLSDLGGTKKDKAFYDANKGSGKYDEYTDEADIYDRISELEEMQHRKVGKWYDDLDEDEVWTEGMKEEVKNGLRYLKQHLREYILQYIKDGGDLDSEEIDPGNDSDFTAALSRKVNDIRYEIKERIEGEITEGYKEAAEKLGLDKSSFNDIDRDSAADEVKGQIHGAIEGVRDNRRFIEGNQENINLYNTKIKTTQDEIAAKEQLIDQMKQQATATKESSQADQQSVDVSKQKAELEGQLEEKTKEHTASIEKQNEELQKSITLSNEAAAADTKAAAAEEKAEKAAHDATQAQMEQNKRTDEGLQAIEQLGGEYDNLNSTLAQQNAKLDENSKNAVENANNIYSAEQKKQQAQALTIKRMEDMLALLKKEYEQEATNEEQRNSIKTQMEQIEAALRKAKGGFESADEVLQKFNEHMNAGKTASEGMASAFDEKPGITEDVEKKKQDAQRMTNEQMQEGIKLLEEEYRKTDHTTAEGIKRREQLRQTIDQMNQEIKESTGEWMSLAQAEELASKAGTSGFFATQQQMQQATQAIERQRDALTKTIQQKQRDGEATKKEEEELQRLEKVLKDLKFEQDNFNMSHKQMENLLKHPKKAEDLDQLKAAIKRADGELHRMKQSLGENNDQYRKFAAEVKNAKNVLKVMEGQAKATTGQLEKAWSRLKTYVGLYMGFNMAWQKFTSTIGDMKELSDRMGEVGKTTQMAAGEIARMTTNLSKMDTRTALTSLVELSAKAGQLGLKSREDVEGFTEAANKMLVALPEMGADGATQMMKVALATGEVAKIQKEMDDGLMEGSSATAVAMEKIASTIDQLRANSAAAAPAITDFVKRVGAVGAQSGISIDQVAALGSTVDALGMRVEMSATALSRMIPAIKNNAFDVAKAIGMAPEALRKMFDEAGGGMNAMLAIFQHIKDQGMNANDIEKMLGMGGMQEIMKELNQQGARAGIVFAGLSQNVDVLREHLGIAGKAYEENIAIQQEYDRMNETTAAKWERLGNQIEEMFVGPGTQSVLGDIADGLRVIVDLVSGPLNTAFWATSAAVLSIKSGLTSLPEAGGKVLDYLRESAYKAGEALREAAEKGEEMSKAAKGMEQATDAVSDIGDALDEAQEAGEQAGEAVGAASGAVTNLGGAARVSIFSVNGLKMAWKGLDTTMKANIIVAVVALLWTLGKALYDAMKATDAERDAVAKANQEADRAVEKLDNYFAKLKEAKEELDKVTKSTGDATDAEIKMTKAKEDHRAAILNINKNYGQYLGFMLTEYDRAELVAAAHDKITAAIRREMLMKAKQAAIEDIGKEYEEGLTKDWSSFSEELVSDKRLSSEQAAEAKLTLKKFLPKSFTVGSDGETLVASNELKKSLGGLYSKDASLNELAAVWFARHLQQNYGLGREAIKDITGIDYYKSARGQYVWTKSRGWSNLRGDYLDEYFEMQQKNAKTGNLYNDDINAETKNIEEQSSALVKELKTNVQAQIKLLKTGNLTTKKTDDAYSELARSLEGINANVSGLTAAEQKTAEDTIKKILEQNKAVIDNKRLQKARENLQKGFDAFDTFDTGDDEKNPWGKALGAESTDWKNMTAEQLVNRRKQMKDFVNAIQTDTDVQAVLKEDAALKAAIEKGMSSDMRTVIEWYNTERLKIQDELHARHLTNTGDWLDPKKERGAKKQFRDEMDAYLHELDAYYTERKTRIEEAGTDEGLTEAEIRNRTLNNEMEWQQRRAELQKLYSRKQKEVTQEELDAIYHIIAERTGDSESFVKAQIAKTNQFVNNIEKSGEKGAAIVHRWMSQVELDTERSYLKGQQALTKQMKAIEAIIDKERPFNGITKSLQESLSTMDILTGEMRKEYNELMKQGKDTADFNARQHQEEMKRTAFLLGEAENAYSTTIDRVMDDMRQKGMTAWADWLSADPKLQEALMAQLRSTYDAIQDAIKKEASQLKKQAEIMWNNILMPDGQTTLKQQIDRIVAQLSLDESRVKRANSLIGAGQASERVADKLAIQQMKVQLAMQEHYYNLMRKRGQATVENLEKEAKAAKERLDWQQYEQKMLDAKHARMSLNLATAKEETELAKQREEIVARTEESQNRLYQELRSWADLLTSSLQGMFEAAHAGDAEYYNELAKMNLTGKGGPGAGTYIVIDDEGTEDATAHYEYLNEREALEREHEIEIQNARAEAWRKLMDDVNMKMSETITDQLNAMLQNKATEDNTAELKNLQTKIGDEMGKMDGSVEATNANTDAIRANTEAVLAAMNSKEGAATGIDTAIANGIGADMGVGSDGVPNALRAPAEGESGASTGTGVTAYTAPWQQPAQEQQTQGEGWLSPMMPLAPETDMEAFTAPWAAYAEMSGKTTKTVMENNKKQAASTSSMFAKMTQAANLYGVAYQAMSNDNLDTAQKFEMIALQAVGNAAIAGLGVALEEMGAKTAVNTAETASKDTAEHGSILGPILTALSTAVLGGLMGLATSKIAKSKSKIASITGANAGAGRLATGMLTYAEGNVNEFTDPASLTPGRRYNVDAADGRKYRARYMGSNPRTHITNGPEFHLSGEKGREMIIDAGTTRQITMNETEVWNAIKTLSGGGRIHHALRRGRGVRAFADGNVEDFMGSGDIATYGAMGAEQMTAFQQSLDRNSAIMERLEANGIKAYFDVYGKGGLVDSYDTGKRTVTRYGESY